LRRRGGGKRRRRKKKKKLSLYQIHVKILQSRLNLLNGFSQHLHENRNSKKKTTGLLKTELMLGKDGGKNVRKVKVIVMQEILVNAILCG
jgi:hypothetical protein